MARNKAAPKPPSPASHDPAAVWVPLDELKVWAKNPRKNDHAVDHVARSIIELGWGRTLVARKLNGELVAGHTARKAALSLAERWNGSTATERKQWHPDAVRTARYGVVPVRFVELDERRAHMLALADNKLNELADWDVGPLLSVMEDFSFEELALAGWEAEEIERMGTEILREGDALLGGIEPEDGAPFLSQDDRRAGGGGDGAAGGGNELEGGGGDDEPPADVDDARPASGQYEVGSGDAPTGEEGAEDSAEDAVPEPPKNPVTKQGDVWLLGNHVLVCGASGSAEVARHIPRDVAISLVTDPPYCSGGFQESGRSGGSTSAVTGKAILNDRLSSRGYQSLIRTVLESFAPLDTYIFTDWKMWVYLFDAVESSGLGIRAMVVWDKLYPGLGTGWRAQHELIQYAHRGGVVLQGKQRGNVVQCKRQRNELHTTQKPVELMEHLVDMTAGDVIADAFSGSGTTLIACEKLSRRCFAVELDPAYCDVTVERWEQFTGKQAVRKAGG